MTDTQAITLKLSQELLQQAQEIAGSAENLHAFLIGAIESEMQRHKSPVKKTKFWENVEILRTKMQQEGIEINTEEIWGDVRDQDLGREIIL
jgi:HPt (histidine-containing phosphotransfer) domain-containing protein